MSAPRYLLGAAACIVALVAGWHQLSLGRSPAVMPSPAETLTAWWGLLVDGTLAVELAITLGRAAAATGAALVVGVLIGWAASVSAVADGFLAPLRAILQGLPPIVLIVCLVLWFGSDPAITIVVTATVMTPLVAAATTAALRAVDPHLRELAAGLRLSRTRRIMFVIGPAVLPPIVGAAGAVASGAVRVAVMAELLSAPDGVGAAIAQARTLLQTPELFAWALTIISAALVVDVAIRFLVGRWSALFSPGEGAVSARTPADTKSR
ncbi:ABC transporter permease [Rhodococcus sp. O3]|uniref:ABC transporter permease n=1 Tax=Rhodococcus sp. O3 TaxID=3404919 RepID=UPI003B680C98